jgi:hypothetical protein
MHNYADTLELLRKNIEDAKNDLENAKRLHASECTELLDQKLQCEVEFLENIMALTDGNRECGEAVVEFLFNEKDIQFRFIQFIKQNGVRPYRCDNDDDVTDAEQELFDRFSLTNDPDILMDIQAISDAMKDNEIVHVHDEEISLGIVRSILLLFTDFSTASLRLLLETFHRNGIGFKPVKDDLDLLVSEKDISLFEPKYLTIHTCSTRESMFQLLGTIVDKQREMFGIHRRNEELRDITRQLEAQFACYMAAAAAKRDCIN